MPQTVLHSLVPFLYGLVEDFGNLRGSDRTGAGGSGSGPVCFISNLFNFFLDILE
jgi:hypothetical protein